MPTNEYSDVRSNGRKGNFIEMFGSGGGRTAGGERASFTHSRGKNPSMYSFSTVDSEPPRDGRSQTKTTNNAKIVVCFCVCPNTAI